MESLIYYYGRYGAFISIFIIVLGLFALFYSENLSGTLTLLGSLALTFWLLAIFFTEDGYRGVQDTFK